ncbi:MAG: transposase [Polyangia bacterium]
MVRQCTPAPPSTSGLTRRRPRGRSGCWPVFGQIKEARGFRRFFLRGLVKVRSEWALIALTHNLLKIYRFQPHAT